MTDSFGNPLPEIEVPKEEEVNPKKLMKAIDRTTLFIMNAAAQAKGDKTYFDSKTKTLKIVT